VVGDDCWHVEVLKNLAKDALTGMDKLAKVPEAVQAQILSRIPLGRFGKPKEIAHDADSAQRKCDGGRSGLRRGCRGRGPGCSGFSLRVGRSLRACTLLGKAPRF